MTALTADQLAQIKALADDATAGPWEVSRDSEWDEFSYRSYTWPERIHKVCRFNDESESENAENNSAFIAASRTAVPALVADVLALLARVAELEAELAAVKLGRVPFANSGYDATFIDTIIKMDGDA